MPAAWPGLFRLVLYYAVLCIPLGLFLVYFVVGGYGVVGHYSILDEGVSALGAAAYILKNYLLYLLSMLFFIPVTHEINQDLFLRPLFFVPLVCLLLLACLFFYPGVRRKLFRERRHAFLASWLFISLLPTIQLLVQNRYVYPAMAPFGLLISAYLFKLREVRAFGRFTGALFAALVIYFAVLPISVVWVKNDTFQRLHSHQADLVQETLGRIGEVSTDPPVNVFYLNMPNAILTFALQYNFDFFSEKGAVRAFPLIITRDPPEVERVHDARRNNQRAFRRSSQRICWLCGWLER